MLCFIKSFVCDSVNKRKQIDLQEIEPKYKNETELNLQNSIKLNAN